MILFYFVYLLSVFTKEHTHADPCQRLILAGHQARPSSNPAALVGSGAYQRGWARDVTQQPADCGADDTLRQ